MTALEITGTETKAEHEAVDGSSEPVVPAESEGVIATLRHAGRLAGESVRWTLGAVMGLHLLALVAFVTPVDAPTVYPDEFSYVAIARDFAGNYNEAAFTELVYQFGFGVMLAPLAWAFDTPYAFHAAAQWLNIALALAVGPMLFTLVRRVFDLDVRSAGVATGLGVLAPATIVQPALLWAESAFTAATVLVVLALVWFVDNATLRLGALLAASLAWAYALHPRGLVLSVAVVLVLAVVAVRHKHARAPIVTTIAVLAALTYTVRRVQAGVAERVFGTGGLPLNAESESDLILNSALPNADRWARGLVGAVWYQGLVTVGLVVVAGWWAIKLIRTHLRSPTTESSLAMAVGLAWGAALVVGALVFLGAERRIDHAVYGRYSGHLAPVLLAIGASLVLKSPVTQARVLRAAVPLVAVGAVVTRLAHPWGFWAGGFAVPNATVFGAVGDVVGLREPLRVGLVATLTIALFVFLLERRGRVALALPAVCLLAVGYSSLVTEIDPRSEWSERHFDFTNEFPLQEGPVVIDDDLEVFITRYGVQYWRPDLEFVNEADAPDESVFWISPSEDRRPTASSRLAGSDDDFSVRFWVEPGRLFDELEFRDRLLWPDIDLNTRIPNEAMAAELVSTTDAEIQIAEDEFETVRVLVRHRGESYPWPTSRAMIGENVVRLGARWYLDGAEVTQSRTDLGTIVDPGSSRTLQLDLKPLDFGGEPLAPGRYEVRIDLLQENVLWFGDVGATTPIEITVIVT